MKTTFAAFLIFFSVTGISISQSGWIQQNPSAQVPISKIYFIDQNTGWSSAAGGLIFVSSGKFMKTTNGGNTWSSILNNSFAYTSFFFINSSTGWLIGNYTNDILVSRRTVLKSSDGGLNWSAVYLDSALGNFNSVYFINYSTGFIAGKDSLGASIMRTTNSGTNWTRLVFPGISSFNDICFLNLQTGFAVGGYNGPVYITTDAGLSWNQRLSLTGVTLNKIFFYDQLTGWIAGSGGIILKTTNSGLNWNALPTGTNASLYGINFPSSDTGYAVSADYSVGAGHVYKTVNGGNNWSDNCTISGIGLNTVFFLNNSFGWIGGGISSPINIGLIYKTTTGGNPNSIEPLSGAIPNKYCIYQNYPNPFNPSTKIKFDLPKSDNTKLVIYDVLGREVATLVNEQLKPGSYEVEWDGSNYASGIYFYQLVAEQYTKTKKMILIK